MRKDEDCKPNIRLPLGGEDNRTNSPASMSQSAGSPPGLNPSPYANLFNSNLYQQYLSQILAAGAANGGNLPPPPINPMLLQAQLAMAASQNPAAAAGLLAAGYASHPLFSNAADRWKQQHQQNNHRYSPYPPPVSSSAAPSPFSSLNSLPPPFSGSRHRGFGLSSPPVSPPHSASPAPSSCSPSVQVKSEPDMDNDQGISSPPLRRVSPPLSSNNSATGGEQINAGASDIKNIEKMINGLDKNKESRS